MAGYTREIYQIGQNGEGRRYSGYAKFSSDNKYLGSRGGYNSKGERAKWNSDRNEGYNNRKSGASALQNTIKMAGVQQDKRAKNAGLK